MSRKKSSAQPPATGHGHLDNLHAAAKESRGLLLGFLGSGFDFLETDDLLEVAAGRLGMEVEQLTMSEVLLRLAGAQPTATAREATRQASATPQYVTLDQAAAMVQRSKRTLEKKARAKNNPLPDPDIQGIGGKASEWKWQSIRPWLEQEYGKKLPDRPFGERS